MDSAFCEQVLQSAIEAGYLGEESPLAAFVDTRGVQRTVCDLHDAFPDHFEHMFAAKANTMLRALMLAREAGMGCEVASPGELEQALRAGFEPSNIVFDEPAKTIEVLDRVLALGVGLNIDNFQEFARVASIVRDRGCTSRIGFRINTQVGAGRITAMSTAKPTSKFGVALEDEGNREALVECYASNEWLTSLHTHVGSQGCSLELMTAGVRKVVDLAKAINSTVGAQQVKTIDIGGGLPVNFESEEVTPTFADYAEILRREVPELFSGEFSGVTEFGRSIYAKNGFIASRIEYTKQSGGRRIATSHAGAQVATRTVFMPEQWKIRVSVFDSSGAARSGEKVMQSIAGPLCFCGDMVGSDRMLPPIEPGDYVVLHDTGAYYFSNPFYYNALPAPAVYAASRDPGGAMELGVWRQHQTMDDVLAVLG